jgi:hypothetical protein
MKGYSGLKSPNLPAQGAIYQDEGHPSFKEPEGEIA